LHSTIFWNPVADAGTEATLILATLAAKAIAAATIILFLMFLASPLLLTFRASVTSMQALRLCAAPDRP